MTLRKIILRLALYSLICFCILNYRNDSLSVEATENYKIYLEAKQAYETNVHNGLSNGFSFLPKKLLDQKGEPMYPLHVSEDGTYLTCELKMPPGTTPSVFNYFFPPFSPCKIVVCDLKESHKGNKN